MGVLFCKTGETLVPAGMGVLFCKTEETLVPAGMVVLFSRMETDTVVPVRSVLPGATGRLAGRGVACVLAEQDTVGAWVKRGSARGEEKENKGTVSEGGMGSNGGMGNSRGGHAIR
jgi:hypothetical protein